MFARYQNLLFLLAVLVLVGVVPGAKADDTLRIRRPSLSSVDDAPAPAPAPKAPAFRVALPDESPSTLQAKVEKDDLQKGGLTQVELKRLADHDIVLLVDKSGSMMTDDCPMLGGSKLGFISSVALGASISRWNWCLEQTAHMARETQSAMANGFSLILFDSGYRIFPHVSMEQLRDIFRDNRPGGGTNLADPLASTFGDYFRRKNLSTGNVKPLLVGIITDGCPNDPDEVVRAIASATHEMRNANEITVIFFLIGMNDRRGERFAYEVSHNLTREGGKFNIVNAVPFGELTKTGLAKALADNLQ